MKIKITSIIMMILIVPTVLAQSNIENVAGITPDNAFYGLDKWWDNMRINFASGLNKEKIKLEVAEERLAEYKIMIDKNKPNEAVLAEVERSNMINSVDTTNLIAEDKLTVQENIQKHIMTLERVRELVPEQAQKGIDNAIESSSKVFDKVEEDIPKEIRLEKFRIIERIEVKEIIIEDKITDRIPPKILPLVCCKIHGLGVNMEKVNIKYSRTSREDCQVPEKWVGGAKEIVDDSLCRGTPEDAVRKGCLDSGGKISQDFPDFNCECPLSNKAHSRNVFHMRTLKCEIHCERGYRMVCPTCKGCPCGGCEKIPDETLCEATGGKFVDVDEIERHYIDLGIRREQQCKSYHGRCYTTGPRPISTTIIGVCEQGDCLYSDFREDTCLCPQESVGFKEGVGCEMIPEVALETMSLYSIVGG